VRAALFYEPHAPLRIEEVATPEPGAGEVLIKVKACGICASDLHIFTGELRGFAMPHPLIPGHEAAGVIAACGAGVDDWRIGDRVVATVPGKTCGACQPCRQSDFENCLSPRIVGVDYHGAFAEYLTFPAHSLVRLPESIPFEQGAILADAVGTPFHAVIVRGGLRAGERVALFGVGGLGTHAVQIARLAGAGQLIAVDVLPAALERARALGADHLINYRTTPNWSRPVREATGGRGADFVMEVAGAETLAESMSAIRRAGHIAIIGVVSNPLSPGPVLSIGQMMGVSAKLQALMVGSRENFDAMCRAIELHRIRPVVDKAYPWTDAGEAIEALRRGEHFGKIVLDF